MEGSDFSQIAVRMLSDHISLPKVFIEVRVVTQSLVFSAVLCRSLFILLVLFLLYIVLFVIVRFTVPEYTPLVTFLNIPLVKFKH